MTNNKQLAEALGWTGWVDVKLSPPMGFPPGADEMEVVPIYNTDLNAMAEVEKELEKRGLWIKYAGVVFTWVHKNQRPNNPESRTDVGLLEHPNVFGTSAIHFALITAPADVKAEAALRVLEEEADEG